MKLNYSLDGIIIISSKWWTRTKINRTEIKCSCLSGDFKQCLLVERHGNRVKIVESTIKTNETWLLFRQLRLMQNMRTSAGSKDYAYWLIQLGNGTLPSILTLNDPEIIEIPQDFLDFPTN
jgi:hypothetical protein